MKIKQLWENLANDKSIKNGLLFRRYSGQIKPDVYTAIQYPEKLLCIYFSIDVKTEVKISTFSNLQEIRVELYPSPNEHEKNILIFKLLNFDHKDIFAVLCEDLIESIENEVNEKKLIHEVLNRFEKWKSLFNKIGLPGLSKEDQMGLYGELFLLRKLILSFSLTESIIKSWVGSDNLVVDFQYSNWGLEVKTSSGNNHQKVSISSERQLDTTNFHFLYLYHISLDIRQKSGETLIDIVDSIKNLIKQDSIVYNMFCIKLLEYGYFDSHLNLYENNGFQIRDEVIYLVENDFPRIEEKDARKGVGDVRYSIILSYCESYSKSENEVFKNLLFD